MKLGNALMGGLLPAVMQDRGSSALTGAMGGLLPMAMQGMNGGSGAPPPPPMMQGGGPMPGQMQGGGVGPMPNPLAGMSVSTTESPTDMAKRYAAMLMQQSRPPFGMTNVLNTPNPFQPSQQQRPNALNEDRVRNMLAEELQRQPRGPMTAFEESGMPSYSGLLGP